MEKISVIVPVYKVEAYIDRCIQSIVDQTYKNLEIILVDDGSPDNCGVICDEWAAKDCRIKVIHKKNGGLSDARNAGLAVATGALISFVDSDDWIEPTFMDELYAAMVENNADIAECDVTYVNEAGRVLNIRMTADVTIQGKLDALTRLVLEDGVYQTVWNKLYRCYVIDGLLFEKGKCNEDDFWTYQVFDEIERLTVVHKPLYNYLQRGSSIMGADYSLKRLDGLEARFQRMKYLQKYEKLASLTVERLQFDCIYHYQCALRWLCGTEREKAINMISDFMRSLPQLSVSGDMSIKQKLWLWLFMRAPNLIARVRNLLNIGL